MIDWRKADYVAGGQIYCATIGHTSVSIIPSLTEPIEWRLDTNIPGVSPLLSDVGTGDEQAVTAAGSRALLDVCNTRILNLRDTLESIELERDVLTNKKEQLSQIITALKPVAVGKPAPYSHPRKKGKPMASLRKKDTPIKKGYMELEDDGPFSKESLKAAREAANLTQRQAAKLLEIGQSSLCDIELGNRRLSAATLVKFAKLYKIDI